MQLVQQFNFLKMSTNQIVSKVWSFCNTLRYLRYSVCGMIQETITNSLKQAEALRQSILKKAFEGRLL
jgi:hypothetical protein